MRLVVVTGMSGAGKSTAMKTLEDLGFFCVDNMPLALLEKFLELCSNTESRFDRIALGVDVRSGDMISNLAMVLEGQGTQGIVPEILFMDCSDAVLIKRFKETRRSHPLAREGRLEDGIYWERNLLLPVRKKADYILDTSNLLNRELREELERIFSGNETWNNLFVTVVSFGFKKGIPTDCDLVFDVRFLPNPYYDEELREKTGNEIEVQNFVMDSEVSETFLAKLKDMVSFLIPEYIREGKSQLVIGIGCTGGHHRSVTIANALYEYLLEQKCCGLKIEHRDINR